MVGARQKLGLHLIQRLGGREQPRNRVVDSILKLIQHLGTQPRTHGRDGGNRSLHFTGRRYEESFGMGVNAVDTPRRHSHGLLEFIEGIAVTPHRTNRADLKMQFRFPLREFCGKR